MGKCYPCRQEKCYKDYDYRYQCDDPDSCTCTCQESEGKTFAKAGLSVLGGVGAFGGGIALTVLTGGLGAVFGGAALMGAGWSMFAKPFSKKKSGERMTGGNYVADVVFGTAISTATGGIGVGGAAIATGATGAAKTGIRIGTEAASALTKGTMSQAKRAVNGKDVNLKTFGKSVAFAPIQSGVGEVLKNL